MTMIITDKGTHRFYRSWDDAVADYDVGKLNDLHNLMEIEVFGSTAEADSLYLCEDVNLEKAVFDNVEDAINWIESREGITVIMVTAYPPKS